MNGLKQDIISFINQRGFLTAEQFATDSGLCLDWVQKLCRWGRVKAAKLNLGNMWLIDKAELKSYQDSNKRTV